ncbi:MAG TPA: sigma-70 family RNA polymerase sigma factor [Pyrinomonadaceae bacterium]|nr:sigma-70 family RNA polymerase sigma factor [Pyrinomonadaceae bacterium]
MAVEVEKLLTEGAARLVARAEDARALDAAAVLPRVRRTLEKYLLRDRPDAPAGEVSQFLDSLRADDLLLVVACERGDERAWEDLMGRFRSTVLSAARGASSNEPEAEELAQSVWAELYGLREGASGAPAGKLAYYSGCGSLGGWLRAVVGQLAVDRHRRTSRLVQTEEASDFDRLAAGSHDHDDGWSARREPDPETALAESEAAAMVRDALAASVASLTDEDRLLVKLYYFDGLRLKEAGALLGVHEATASRRLTRIQRELREGVERNLTAERGWTHEEAKARLADVASRLDTDVRSMLAAEPAGREESRTPL